MFKIEKNAGGKEEWNVLEGAGEATPGEFADGKAEEEAQAKIFDSLVSKCARARRRRRRRRARAWCGLLLWCCVWCGCCGVVCGVVVVVLCVVSLYRARVTRARPQDHG